MNFWDAMLTSSHDGTIRTEDSEDIERLVVDRCNLLDLPRDFSGVDAGTAKSHQTQNAIRARISGECALSIRGGVNRTIDLGKDNSLCR